MIGKKIIAGNWKMNKTPAQAKILSNELVQLIKEPKCDVVICPPSICIPVVVDAVRSSEIKVGSQNVHFAEEGAYTGELAPKMLVDLNVKYAIIGHSERRQYFGETDEVVNKRTVAALKAGITPIVCIGENLQERDLGITDFIVGIQLTKALVGIKPKDAEKIVIAYEPVWAIGTGVTATSVQANYACKFIRKLLREIYNAKVAATIRIQYGGSMNKENAAELLSMSDIDGGLIGGASLSANTFSDIVNICNEING